MNFETEPASIYPIPDLVETLNRGFENYFVPIAFNVNTFLTMVRKDGVDLTASRVLLAEGEPAGIALLARRGWTSRLVAMGIAQDLRGKGAGSWLMNQIIQEACDRGEREMVLEVIEQNEAAVHLYQKCGFEIVRRLIGFIRRNATENEAYELEEMDIREASRLLSQHGLPDLPWQLSSESIAQHNPPARAYASNGAYIVISNPYLENIAVWSLFTAQDARDDEPGTQLLKAVIAQFAQKTWHVPALLPEELGNVYQRAGFTREELSQWQMKRTLSA